VLIQLEDGTPLNDVEWARVQVAAGVETEATQEDEPLQLLLHLKRGDCWCEMAIDNPMIKSHSDVCKRLQQLFSKT